MVGVREDDVDEDFLGVAHAFDHGLSLLVGNVMIEPAPDKQLRA
jgi:hypothetical protein